MVVTYSRVFRSDPALSLHCSDPLLPYGPRKSWNFVKTKSLACAKAISTAIRTTAHYHISSSCQPGGVTHTFTTGVNRLNGLTESMYTSHWSGLNLHTVINSGDHSLSKILLPWRIFRRGPPNTSLTTTLLITNKGELHLVCCP